jgi:nicotinate-nucleotide pyrophosphorylase (carboxylating)
MNFKGILKERIHHDLGFDFYRKDGYPNSKFEVIFKESALIAGTIFIPTIIKIVEEEFFLEDFEKSERYNFDIIKRDGERTSSRETIMYVSGNANVLLKAERTICNILSELSGIATHVKEVLSNLDGSVFLLDTRKNDPLFRPEHKYAINLAGGKNHRSGFFDGVLIKDNDIAIFGSIKAAIDNSLKNSKLLTKIEIEVGSIEDLQTVLSDGRVDAILLDNMSAQELKIATEMISKSKKKYLIEASGIREENIKEVSKTGVEFISMSSLVRRARYIDVSMKVLN